MNEDDDALSALAYQQELEHQQWLLENELKPVDFIEDSK